MTLSAVLLTSLFTLHSLPFTTYEFRTGMDGSIPRAYVEVQVKGGQSYSVTACATPLDVKCQPLNGIGPECYDPCRHVGEGDKSTCRSSYAPVARAVYQVTCGEGLVPAYCNNRDDVDNTKLCQDPEGGGPPRASMPFAVRCAPFEGGQVNYEKETTVGTGASISGSFPTEVGTIRYSCAIVPQKLYIPTEGETGDPGGQYKLDPNTLSLFLDKDNDGDGKPDLKKQSQIDAVLRASEGAYVEGVIRFEVASQTMNIARRPRAP